jgi:hypothetical protein
MKYCLLCLVTVFLAGCITTAPIQKLPTTLEAFRAPPDQLRAEYPEIAEYEKTIRILEINIPYANQLVTAWGEPDQKKTDWLYPGTMGAFLVGSGFVFGPAPALITAGMIFAIRPFPFEYYYWRKGDYCIEARIDRAILHAYKESLVYWKWHHMSDGKEIPTECKK